MSREMDEFEYKEIILPLYEEELNNILVKINKYEAGSIERNALTIFAQIKEIEIQYVKLHILELTGPTEELTIKIKENKSQETKLRGELDALGLNIVDL
jgi:hypothetical protein